MPDDARYDDVMAPGNAFVSNPSRQPWWRDYRDLIERLGSSGISSPGDLTALLPPGTRNANGMRVRFVAAGTCPGAEYERRIFETGEVPTREANRHDLFNALAWCRWPALKAAMNARHYRHLDQQHGGRRGPQRDALAHLDESGAVVASASPALLDALAERDWNRAFVDLRHEWRAQSSVILCGHGLMEKLLEPYKSVTAHTLLLRRAPPGALPISRLDRAVGEAVASGELLRAPADLAQLPLMGIPEWWPDGLQDAGFYADRRVFRPPPAGARRPPVTPVSGS